MFSAQLKVNLLAEMTGALDIERLTTQIDRIWSVSLAEGTGAGQADQMWSDSRTLASNTAETLDLNGNAVKDAFGNNLLLDRVKILLIVAAPTNTTNLTVGNVANGFVSPFIDADNGVIVRPGGIFVIAAPDATAFAVTAGTADLLRISNAAGAEAKYDIVVVGT